MPTGVEPSVQARVWSFERISPGRVQKRRARLDLERVEAGAHELRDPVRGREGVFGHCPHAHVQHPAVRYLYGP